MKLRLLCRSPATVVPCDSGLYLNRWLIRHWSGKETNRIFPINPKQAPTDCPHDLHLGRQQARRNKARTACCLVVLFLMVTQTGCRSIRRISENRQSIAARRLSGQGFNAMQNGRWDIAETLFSDALGVSRVDDRAHWGLAESLWQRGEHDLAIDHMEQAVRLSASDPKRVHRLGRMYLQVGRLAEANQQSEIALESARDSAEAWALHGDCLQAAGMSDEALAAYHRALAIQPAFPEVQLQAAEIYHRQGRYGRLLATLDRLQDCVGCEATPARADVLQGIAMRQVGRMDEAEKSFHRASGKDPSDATPHLELASLLLDSGDAEQANLAITTALKLDPNALHQGQWAEEYRRQQARLADEQFQTIPPSQLR